MDNIKIRIPLTVSQRQQTIPLGVQAGGGGTRNYNALANKPAINGHELVGDQTAAELGLATPEDIPSVPTKTSELTNDSGFVNAAGAAAAAPVQSVNGKTGEVTLDAEDVGALPDSSTLDDIPDGATYKRPTAAQVQQIATNAADIQTQGGEIDQLQTDVDAIEQKIPNQASAQNQLADKDFVNSSINSAAAYFRGTFPTRAALFAVPWQTTDPAAENYVSNNDYAYVADDETHNDEAWRYIYVLQPGGTDNGWQAQFRVNESPLTAAQLAALNSGATAAHIEQISTNAAAIALKQAIINASGILKGNGNGQVSAAVAGTDYQTPLTAGTDYATPAQVNAKYSKPAGGIPKTDLAQEVQTSLGKADTALQAVPVTYRTAAAQDVIDEAQDAEIDDLRESKAPVIINTASGAIASFEDGSDGMPLKKLVVNIEPVQSGSGDPSPTNIRPISGCTGCNIACNGDNLINPVLLSPGNFNASGDVVNSTSANSKHTEKLPIKGGITYTLVSTSLITYNSYYCFYDKDKVFISSSLYYANAEISTFTAPENACFIACSIRHASGLPFGMSMYLGRTDKNKPYIGTVYPITFPTEAGTVYGGKLTINEDGSGELRKRPYYASYNGETLVGPWLSSMDVYAEDATPTIGAQVVDLGGEETVYQLTDLQVIDTLYGTNNIWADCGDVEVTYRADTKLYIQKINAPSDDDMTADAQIASGRYFIIGNTLYKSTTVIPAGDTVIPGTNCIKTNLAEALNALNT